MSKIIAECCQNHNGDKAILKDMVWAAAESGADYVKIQTIFADDLTNRERFEEGKEVEGVTEVIKRPYQPEYDRLKKLELDNENHQWFIDECRKAGVAPMTTVFTRGRAAELAAMGWSDIKIASYDCGSLPLLREVKEHFSSVIVSTGATYDEEIAEAAKVLEGVDATFLHCVTIYPTPLDQMHLARMEYLRSFVPSVGFSDHSLVSRDGIIGSAVALMLGADVVERHFTILGPDETKDGPVSITPDHLKELCTLAKGSQALREEWVAEHVGDYQQMMGSSQRSLSHAELLNRDYYRGRFAARNGAGDVVYNWEEGAL